MPVLAIGIWMVAPYAWYPSFENLDTTELKNEAELLQSRCAERKYPDNLSAKSSIEVKASEIPYILSLDIDGLDNKGYQITCDVGVYVRMWSDWWVGEAGIYILREGQTLPLWIEQEATPLGGGIFKFHTDS